jgi:thiosulfate/3-mercaptopyruvate sulfurtransferase
LKRSFFFWEGGYGVTTKGDNSMQTLIDPQWLDDNLGRPDLVLLDCVWHLPTAPRRGSDDFLEGHIPGARHFDLEIVSDPNSPYVNMLPRADDFAAYVGGLGIGNDTTVVVYDSGYVSARVWWMFRYFGHAQVHILDGGLRRWRADGRAIASGAAAPIEPQIFVAKPTAGWVAEKQDVAAALAAKAQVVDARTATRFSGAESSGYVGVPGGHMPGAVNLPWSRLMPQDGDFRFVSPDVARTLFADAGVDVRKPIIATCGSGVTAAILVLMLSELGDDTVRLYDGSWHEWAQQPELPKAGQTSSTS